MSEITLKINSAYFFIRKKDMKVFILTSKFVYKKDISNRRVPIQNYIEVDGVIEEISVDKFNNLGLSYVGVI